MSYPDSIPDYDDQMERSREAFEEENYTFECEECGNSTDNESGVCDDCEEELRQEIAEGEAEEEDAD